MPFANHTRVTMLSEYRSDNSVAGATFEVANPGFSISGWGLTQGQRESVESLIGNKWHEGGMCIPGNCFYTGTKFTEVEPDGKTHGAPVVIAGGTVGGGSASTQPTFMAQVATLESNAAGVLRRKRGRIYFPCGNQVTNGVYNPQTSSNFAQIVAGLLGAINDELEQGGPGHVVCTASRKDATNYPVNAVSADNVPDYVSSRKHSIRGIRSSRFDV